MLRGEMSRGVHYFDGSFVLCFSPAGHELLRQKEAMATTGNDDQRCRRCLFHLGGRCCHALAPEPPTCTYFKTAVSGVDGDSAAVAGSDGPLS